MIRFRKVAGLLWVLTMAGAIHSVAQSPTLPSPRLPGIPGIRPIEAPRTDGPGTARAIGAVDLSKLPDRAEILNIDKIWDRAPHNAFTDLIRFQQRWYCAFREGSKHVSPDGAVRVITSADGVEWSTAFHLATEYADIRDPKFSITSDERIMLSAVAAYNPPTEIGHQSLAWYSIDGRNWGVPFKIGDPEHWLWNVTWHRGSAYSMSYSTTRDRYSRMYVGPTGLRFRIVADRVVEENKPSEAVLLFNRDDSAVCLLRRDGEANSAQLGVSRPPYRGWFWRDLGVSLGGPALLRLPDGRLIAAGRRSDGERRTVLHWVNEEDATLEDILTLPSGGDNSYPGLVWHDGVLWVSYYSSHEGKAAIYLAKIRLPERQEETPIDLPKFY